MATVFGFLFRLFLLAAGLVFAASLAFVFVVALIAWALRRAWGALTGRPVQPFVVRLRPGQGFARVYPRAQPQAAGAAAAGAGPLSRASRIADVTDVQPK